MAEILTIIQMWTVQRLAGISLKSLGLRVQLGHSRGDFCVEPMPADEFVIIDASGIHEVNLDFCGCPDGGTRVQQLREARLYSKACANPTSAVAYEMVYAVNVLQPPITMRVAQKRTPIFEIICSLISFR